jgi:hypothetical protein
LVGIFSRWVLAKLCCPPDPEQAITVTSIAAAPTRAQTSRRVGVAGILLPIGAGVRLAQVCSQGKTDFSLLGGGILYGGVAVEG